ncbi:TetR family transcriptional regulator [Actinoplanes sp. TBRC 11911]|uniref:TetR family transcriptional regulator n=1 Tax=Actinoplanes sp. TBRC 11911 TaxID=2729386 RepID=UPI0020071921|nr:TetR family transcriptional regulator [Actinoplanes sp. TBRC 11911]
MSQVRIGVLLYLPVGWFSPSITSGTPAHQPTGRLGNVEHVVTRNPEDAKRRILAAATAEFAAHGIAGARMDRVAERATSSKERIYAYFGNKDELFDIVYTASIRDTLDAVKFNAHDLPAYVGRMFDYFADNPDSQRLTIWYRLERPTGPGLNAVIEANEARIAALAGAQADGLVTTRFTPGELLTLIQAMAASWNTLNPEFARTGHMGDREHRRDAVMEAVARLIA